MGHYFLDTQYVMYAMQGVKSYPILSNIPYVKTKFTSQGSQGPRGSQKTDIF